MESEGQNKRLVSTWEAITKDDEGEAHVHTLHKHTYEPDPVSEDLFVSRAAPTRITPTRRTRPQRSDELTLVFGDAQIGYRGEEAFHDERAMALAQIAIRELMPNRVIFVGDMIDLPSMSRFDQRSDWQGSTQRSLDRYHSFLAETRANAPDAEIVSIEGNHELRMDKMIRKDAAELLGIRRANAESALGILTMRYLVRMDELEVTSVTGYPNAAYWLNDNLKATHGTNVAKGGSNAAKYLRETDTGTIYGHTHRVETAYRTIATRNGYRTIVASSPGTLARITGEVPGFHYSVDELGSTVQRAEDWQQGMNIVETSKEHEHITPVVFYERGMNIHGKHYELEGDLGL